MQRRWMQGASLLALSLVFAAACDDSLSTTPIPSPTIMSEIVPAPLITDTLVPELQVAKDVPAPTFKWHLNGQKDDSISQLTISDGVLYGTGSGLFRAYKASTGEQLWSVQLESEELTTPLIANNVAYIGLSGIPGYMEAISLTDRHTLWKTAIAPQITEPTLDSGTLYFAGQNIDANTFSGDIYALDAGTGAVKWHTPYTGRQYTAPLVSGGLLFIADESNAFALDAATGKEMWKIPAQDGSVAAFILSKDALYFQTRISGYQNTLISVNSTTGQQNWTFTLLNTDLGQVAVSGDILYMGSVEANAKCVVDINRCDAVTWAKSEFLAVDAETGRELWAMPLDGFANLGPIIDGDFAYTTEDILGPSSSLVKDDYVLALNLKEHRQLWRFQTQTFLGNLLLHDGVLYFGENIVYDDLYALSVR